VHSYLALAALWYKLSVLPMFAMPWRHRDGYITSESEPAAHGIARHNTGYTLDVMCDK